MGEVEELKRFAVRHAHSQGISRRRCLELFPRIRNDDRGLPGSWVWEWRREAEALERQGRLLESCNHYNMARFPYVDGAARQYVSDRSLSVFSRWRKDNADIQRVDLNLDGGAIGCWASGLSATDRKPLLVIMDGIVNPKERWVSLLADARRLGMAGVITEMPGVGENLLRYDAESWQMLSAVLDEVSGLADVAQTYAMAVSFGGHLALRCAAEDERIRGVVTISAPIAHFFNRAVPRRYTSHLILDTLAHISRTPPGETAGHLRGLALTEDILAKVSSPVYYMACAQDEIIPGCEVSYLRRYVRDLHLIEADDVHGSSRRTTENRLWAALSLLQMRGVRRPRRAVVGARWHTARARRRLTDRTFGAARDARDGHGRPLGAVVPGPSEETSPATALIRQS